MFTLVITIAFVLLSSDPAAAAIATTTSLNASVNPARLGQTVILTATVAPAPGGKVTFYDGTAVIGVAPVAAGAASLQIASLASGLHSVFARYDGDATHGPSTSAKLPLPVTSLPAATFLKLSPLSAANPTVALALDLNNDRIPDLVAVQPDGTLNILLGRGDGTFAAGTTLSLNAIQVAAGDFNGDGNIDLAVTISQTDTIAVLLGAGDGTFSATSIIPVSGDGFVLSIQATDFNADGMTDILVSRSASVAVLPGNGDGTFGPPIVTPVPEPYIDGLTVADFNLDGVPDLITFSNTYGEYYFAGNGDGTFTGGAAVGPFGPSYSLIAADFNGDGKPDLLSEGYGSQVCLGNGDGTFAAPVNLDAAYTLAADVNGDGKLDVLSATNVGYGNGDGTFQPTVTLGGVGTLLTVADFNNNGQIDLLRVIYDPATAVYSPSVFLGTNISTVTLSVSPIPATYNAPVTFSATVSPQNATGTVGFYDGDTLLGSTPVASGFATVTANAPFAGRRVFTAVYSGDNVTQPAASTPLTVVVNGTPSTTTLSASTTAATYGQTLTLTATVSPSPTTGAVSFLDGANLIGSAPVSHGIATLSTAALSTGTHSLTAQYDGGGSISLSSSAALLVTVNSLRAGSFIRSAPIFIPGEPALIFSADLNHDGNSDLILTGSPGSVDILLATGPGTFAAPVTYAVPAPPVGVLIADVNGDGAPDLIVQAANGLSILLGNGDGTFRTGVSIVLTTSQIAAADINRDGRIDLIVSSPQATSLSILLGNGDGTFQPSFQSVSLPQTGPFAVADVNGDGIPDIVESFGGSVVVYSGNGDGTFGTLQTLIFSGGAQSIAIGDVNHDGHPDLIIGCIGSLTVILGSADGQFTAATSYSFGLYGQFISILDIDGDGNPDVIVQGSGIGIYLGNGDGTFRPDYGADVSGPLAFGDFFHTGRVSAASIDYGNLILTAGVRPATVTLSATPSPGALGQPVTLTAAISPSDATGTVTFLNNYSLIATVPVNSGTATFTTSAFPANRQPLISQYSGDAITSYAYSNSFVETIVGSPSAVSMSASAASAILGKSLTFTASITPLAATGVITFIAGTQVLGSAPLANGVASFTTASLPAGTSLVRAVYEGNPTYTAGSASPSVAISVTTVAGSTFRAKPLSTTPYGQAVASADFNGDGIADLLLFSSNFGYGNSADVLLGAGDGTFSLGAQMGSGSQSNSLPCPLLASDFNGDGRPDIAFMDYGSYDVSVYLNQGNGTFQEPIYTGFTALAMTASDFNGDGIPDLLLVDLSMNIQVLTGTGDGYFLPFSQTFPAGANNYGAAGVVTADFNGDGKADVAVSGYNSESISVFLGNGDASLQPPINLNVGQQTGTIISADLNGDGIPDLAFLAGASYDLNAVQVLIGKGDGSFQAPVSYPALDTSTGLAASDFNGDGKLDLVVQNGSTTLLLYGNGDGTLQPGVPFSGPGLGVAIGDYNGDGRADIPGFLGALADTITLTSSESAVPLAQPLTLTATVSPAGAPGTVTFYDGAVVLGNVPVVNGVATLVIQPRTTGLQQITARYQGGINYTDTASVALPIAFTSIAGGGFASAVNYAAGASPTAIITADFNNDGKLDLAIANGQDNTVSILWGGASGTFGSNSTFPVGSQPATLATADLNGDGLPDLLVGNAGSKTITVLLSTGGGAFTPGPSLALRDAPYAIATGDLNGDGRLDIVVTQNSFDTSLYFGNGDGSFTLAPYTPLFNGNAQMGVGDFNRDGNLDVLLFNSEALGDGHGNFTFSNVNFFGGQLISIADFNSDGKLDVAFADTYDTQNFAVDISLGNGDGTFAPSVAYPAASSIVFFASGDFNGDGFPDLAIVHSSASGAGNIGMMLGNGDGSFQPELTFMAGSQTAALAIGDFNGDGRLDIAAVNTGSNNVSVLLGIPSNGCSFTVSPASFAFDDNGGAATVTITASSPSCAWSANLVESYNTQNVAPASGTGSGTFTVTIPSNRTNLPATARIDVANLSIPVSVAQTTQQFVDVPPGVYYFDAVNLLNEFGITAGCSASDFCPQNAVTRAEMAIFIVRGILHTDDFTYTAAPYFTDVPVGAFGFQWIQKLRDLGITSGCSPTEFCPAEPVTRAQAAVFLIRARYGVSTVFPYSSSPFFTDVPTGAFGFEWIQRLKQDNITGGCSPTLFCPDESVIRGDMAVFLIRALFNQLLPANEPAIDTAYGAPNLTVIGTNTHFDQAATQVIVPGLNITAITVYSSTNISLTATRDESVPPGPESVTVITGSEVAVGPNITVLP